MKISICIANLNCLEHTKNLVSDLLRQEYTNFSVTIFDQNSTEPGTQEFYDSVKLYDNFKVILNGENRPLNHLWNDFIESSESEYICLLNNDIRIPKNFIKDVVVIFDNYSNVGAIMHPTNHPKYQTAKIGETTFNVVEQNKFRQGWDICIRKKAWTKIPEVLRTYCGDDFIFKKLYEVAWDIVVVATSSPIIHYLGQTRQSPHNPVIPGRNPKGDIANFRKLGYVNDLTYPKEYTVLEYKDSPVDIIYEEYKDGD